MKFLDGQIYQGSGWINGSRFRWMEVQDGQMDGGS